MAVCAQLILLLLGGGNFVSPPPDASPQTALTTIHVMVALCDNANQGIVPVPPSLGNGQDPNRNLYWGAGYGVRTYFQRSTHWQLIRQWKPERADILERCLFRHKATGAYLLAEAYDGASIQRTTEDFFAACAGRNFEWIRDGELLVPVGGGADLLAYVGHDGLMEFQLSEVPTGPANNPRQAIMLACISKDYFAPWLRQTGAQPLVWTTGLMAPEAYTLEAALHSWLLQGDPAQVREAAAQAYHQFQQCGIKGARRLLVSGY